MLTSFLDECNSKSIMQAVEIDFFEYYFWGLMPQVLTWLLILNAFFYIYIFPIMVLIRERKSHRLYSFTLG